MIAGVALFTLAGCKPREPEEPVEDAAAYLGEKLPETDLRHWIKPYLDMEPAFVKEVAEAYVEKEDKLSRNGISLEPRQLDRMLDTTFRTFFLRESMGTEERRAAITGRAEARMENPPMAKIEQDGIVYAVIDYWVLPGVWKKPLRQSTSERLEMVSDGKYVGVKDMDPEFFRESLRKVSERFPGAAAYDIRARRPEGGSSGLVRYVYFPHRDGLERETDGIHREFSDGPLGGMEKLLDGSAGVGGVKWKIQTQGDDRIDYTLPPAREPMEE